MRRAAWLVVLATSPVAAAPWSITGEAGAELDTNVARVESGPDSTDAPITAPVARFGLRAQRKDRWLDGAYVLGVSDLTRLVADDRAKDENVTLLAADLRWVHPIADRPVAAGLGLTGADALPIGAPVGSRTFLNLGTDAVLAAHQGDDRHVMLTFGARHFEYKPDPAYDWDGPSASARLELVLWQPPAATRSLELAVSLGFDARFYDAYAFEDTCPPHAPADPMCRQPTDLHRRDRFERIGAELTWTGRQVATLGYQLTVVTSNSYGESFLRHRLTGSVTTTLPGELYATVLAVLQIERYLDGLIVQSDPLHAEYTSIDDENRSTLQLRVARKLSASWSLEARAAAWRNLGNSSMDSFHRELVYGGIVFSR
jgi:hypothetical protein